MKKKTYKQPQMNIIEVKSTEIICQSQIPSAQNESYEDGNTDGWFN